MRTRGMIYDVGYSELQVGDVYRSRFGRTVLEADNVWFTLLTLNTNPIHFDAAYAATTEWQRPGRTRGLNQRDEVVIEFERSIMLPL
jgi:acyl dehydratase